MSSAKTIETLVVGDRINIYSQDGEVVEVDGPHGPLGTPATEDWFTLRVLFDGSLHPSTVGPKRGSDPVAAAVIQGRPC